MKKKDIATYILFGSIALANLGVGIGIFNRDKERKQLDSSNYVFKLTSGPVSFYSYDDDSDGIIDRIEERGAIGKCPGPTLPVERTYLNRDPEFDHYLDLIKR